MHKIGTWVRIQENSDKKKVLNEQFFNQFYLPGFKLLKFTCKPLAVENQRFNPFIHNVVKWPNVL